MDDKILQKLVTATEANTKVLNAHTELFTEHAKILHEHTELLHFMVDNMATKQELQEFKDEMHGFKDEMYGFRDEMHGFRDETNGRLISIEGTLGMMTRDITDIKVSLTRLEKRTKEDADAAARDILELRHRVEFLEQKIKKLELTNS